MRTKAERVKQIRNALAASAAALFCAAIAALTAQVCFKPGAVIVFLCFAATFAAVLAILILLWKKTDLIRKVLYMLYCIKNPKETRKCFCPCCDRDFVSFSDFKLYEDTERYDPARFRNNRQDVFCPFCYSAPRQRILAHWANGNVNLLKNSKILYFAPEYSMMKWVRHNNIKLTTADLFDPKTDLKLDITAIDLPDDSYDMVICNHVLEHVSSYGKALSELNRILKRGGKLIISFPVDISLDTVFEKDADTPEERVRLFGQNDHVRVFGKDSADILASFGFSVSVIDAGTMPEKILPVTGPADYDSNIIFSCIKETGNLEKTGIKDENYT